MATPVPRRWKILLAVGLSVGAVDQWTKFLAVKHLTPGVAQAATGQRGPLTEDRRQELLAGMSLGDQLGAFYGSVKGPCDSFAAHCPTVEVVGDFWNFRYVENPGAAWGLFSKASDAVRVPFFLFVSLAAMVFIVTFLRKLEEDQLMLMIALALVFGGALGNFIDRLHLSYVIDFIDWYVGTKHWPTFNFADAAITTGVAFMVIDQIRDAIRARKRRAQAPTAS